MMKYVCGFLFDKNLEWVVLIEKLRPPTQHKKINGVGGKIEAFETPYDAMCREFKEETGVIVNEWKDFCFLHGQDYEITYFYSVKDLDVLGETKSITDEKVSVYLLENVFDLPIMPNLNWIIPMAITHIKGLTKSKYNIEAYH